MISFQTIFISFNKSQNMAIQDIIKYKINNNNKNNYYLITTMENYPKCIPVQNICFLKFEKSIRFTINEIFNRSLFKQINIFLLKHILVYKNIEVLTPHLMNIPSNYIVNKLHRECSNVKISNYPDGIAQLYNANIEWTYKNDLNIYKVLFRFICGNIIGLRYRFIIGSLFSTYRKLDIIYTYAANLLPENIKCEVYQIYPEKKEIIGKNIILISSIASTKININYYLQLFFKNNNSKLDKEPCQIYYKPHPRENNTISDLGVKYKYPLFIIDKRENLEDAVINYKCNQVISIGTFSTTLINLRLIYGTKIKLSMVGIVEQLKGKNYKKLKRIFDYFKIDEYVL